jgi:hypothetical protein
MGNDAPKTKRPAFNRINYEIVCAKVYHHATLQRDRKINDLQKGEGKLKELFNATYKNSPGIIAQANECLDVLKYVKGTNIVLRNVNLLKDQSLNIEEMYKTHRPLGELEALVYTVVWSTKRLNLTVVQEFNNLIRLYFDPNIFNKVEESMLVDLELQKNFKSMIPGPLETNEYLEKFCERNNIDKFVLLDIWPKDAFNTAPTQNTGYNPNQGGGYPSGPVDPSGGIGDFANQLDSLAPSQPGQQPAYTNPGMGGPPIPFQQPMGGQNFGGGSEVMPLSHRVSELKRIGA